MGALRIETQSEDDLGDGFISQLLSNVYLTPFANRYNRGIML
jgi:hypothetical protein